MNTRKRLLIPATAILALIGFCFVTIFRSPAPRDRNSGEKRGKESSSESFASDARVAYTEIKTRSRIRATVPTLEETIESLRNTVVPMVDLPPDRSLTETADAINKLLQEAGIPPHQLKVTYDKSSPRIGNLRYKAELRLRNVPVAVILKYVCDSTILRYAVRPGVVIFYTQTDDTLKNLPLLEPARIFKEPVDPNDPFGPAPVEQADPFAEPSGR